MKSRIKVILKLLSLSIILSSSAFGLFAQNKYSNYLALNSKTLKRLTIPKTSNSVQLKLAILEESEIIEDRQNLEDWMFNISLKSDQIELEIESWMLDDEFWEIQKPFEWDVEPVEEDREIEPWMTKFKIKRVGCVDIYTDFIEKEWMKKHSFFIL